MRYYCKDCGQVLSEEDIKCWHCGKKNIVTEDDYLNRNINVHRVLFERSNTNDDAEIIFCFLPNIICIIIGVLLLLPALFGEVFFFMSLYGFGGTISNMSYLGGEWIGEKVSYIPIYLGLMALSSVILISNSLRNIAKLLSK